MNNAPEPQNPIEAVTHPDPYPYYRRLVRERPLYYDEAIRMWVASSAGAVTAVLTNPLCRVRPTAEPVPKALVGSIAGDIFGRLVRMIDGPEHDRLKAAVVKSLGVVDAAHFEARCQRRAEALFSGDDPSAYAFQLPAVVIGEMVGLEEQHLEMAAAWVGDFVRGISPLAQPVQIERGRATAGDLRDSIGALYAHRQPDELLGRLSSEAECVGGIGPEALVANAIGFLAQAYEATTGLIGNTLIVLARRPELLRQVRAEPGLLPAMIAEVLRIDPPIQNTRRWVGEDGMVAGQLMQAGDAILVVLAAANHDPAANPAPEQFDISRPDRRIFSFGVGPHACPGQSLAVIIAAAGVRQLISADVDFPRLPADFTYQPSMNARIPIFGGGARSNAS